MKRELVPEIHDIFKLTKYGHLRKNSLERDIPKELRPDTPTWQGIIGHHAWDDVACLPNTKDTFILHMADGLAAGFSRVGERTKGERDDYVVRKLWNPHVGADLRLTSHEEIRELLSFLRKDPSAEDFFARYKEKLLVRPEDTTPGINVTSLLTHSVLTGKLYRILRSASFFAMRSEEIGATAQEIGAFRKKKSQEWRLNVARCSFQPMLKPMRGRDLNIFDFLRNLNEEILRKYSDNLLLATSDYVLLVFAGDALLKEITDLAFEKGLRLSITQRTSILKNIGPEMKRMQDTSKEGVFSSWNAYPELPDEIEPPICELCQMSAGTRTWPHDFVLLRDDLCDACRTVISSSGTFAENIDFCEKDRPVLEDYLTQGREHLCERCFKVRCAGSRINKLAVWSEEGMSDVAYVKIKLDYDELVDVCSVLLTSHARKQVGTAADDDNLKISFSVIAEFQSDYKLFLDDFQTDLLRAFAADNVQEILKEFWCVRIETLRDVLKLLAIYESALSTRFPAFSKTMLCPIKITMVLAGVKYPFFNVWPIVQSGAEIGIYVINAGRMEAKARYLDQLLLADQKNYNKSSLHKLAEVARQSEILARLMMEDKDVKSDYQNYRRLKEDLLPLGMDFRSIYTFARILGE